MILTKPLMSTLLAKQFCALVIVLMYNAAVLVLVIIQRISFVFYMVAILVSMSIVHLIIRNTETTVVEKPIESILKIHKTMYNPKTATDTECIICFDEYNEESEIGILLCSHYFHHKCIEEWRKGHDICPYKCPTSSLQVCIV